MTVVSSQEFAANQNKYYDLAIDEDICIKRGNNMFQLMCTDINNTVKERVYCEPDEDFYKSISMDELLEGVLDDIHKFYANK